MGRQISTSLVILAAASTLVACASTAPTESQPKAAEPVVAAQTATTAEKSKSPGSGYRRVTKNGVDYFCKRESFTGSRTDSVESCRTQAQIDAARDNTQDLLRRIQQTPGSTPGTDSSGGIVSGVMQH